MADVKILGIPGSLRQASFNRFALQAAQSLLPPGASLDIFELEGIPPYNQDHDKQPPARVVELKARVRAADAVLFSTPEYNYSMPGVLKNAIDWLSRPAKDIPRVFGDKPVAIMGASIGMLGTARAQYHLRQCFVFLNMHAVNQPEVLIANAAQRFNDKGELTDETSRELVRKLLAELVAWTTRLGKR